MIVLFNLFLFIILAFAGSFVTKINNNSINNLLLNIEFSLFISVFILYFVGIFIYNPIAIYIVCTYIIFFAALGFRSNYLSINNFVFQYRSIGLFSLFSIIGPVIILYFNSLDISYQGDAFYSWSTWANHWSIRESLADYKFVYSQNLPIIMSFFNRLYGSSEIISAGSMAYKIFIIQYLFIFISRFFISFKTFVIKRVWVDILLYFILLVIFLKTNLFYTAQSGLPDIFVGLIFFSIILNKNKILKRPILLGVMIFGLANLKLTSLPFALTLLIYFSYRSSKISFKKLCSNFLIMGVTFLPFIIDYNLPIGDNLQNHTHHSSLNGYKGVSSNVMNSNKNIIKNAFIDYDNYMTSEKNHNFIKKHFHSLEIFDNYLENNGKKGSIYFTPLLFDFSEKMLSFYTAFKNDIAIYLIIASLGYVIVFYSLVGIPILISLIIWWQYTSYGFYNLNGSYVLLILSLYYFFYIKRNFYSFVQKKNYKVLIFCLIFPFLIGQKLSVNEDFNEKIIYFNKIVWTNTDLLKGFDVSVTDDAYDGELFLEIGKQFPNIDIAIPLPFDRLDGRFKKPIYSEKGYKNLQELEFYHSYRPGSLMLDNFSVNFTKDFLEKLEVVDFEGLKLSCLTKDHAFIKPKYSTHLNKVIDIGKYCNSPQSNIPGLKLTCPKVNYFASNNYSPMNGLYLKADIKKSSSLWWKFSKSDNYIINLHLSKEFNERYSLELTSVNEYKIFDQKGNLLHEAKHWPSAEKISLKETKLSIVFSVFDGSEPRFIAHFTPKNKSIFVNSCGEFSDGNLCLIKGGKVSELCSDTEK